MSNTFFCQTSDIRKAIISFNFHTLNEIDYSFTLQSYVGLQQYYIHVNKGEKPSPTHHMVLII